MVQDSEIGPAERASAQAAPRRRLEAAIEAGGFEWLTGIEDTFIVAPHEKTGRTLDEYELTGHYEQWQGDLELASSLGVGVVRYGVPWHRISPAPGTWDWSWTDRALDRWLSLGIDPVVDLVHYGTPRWMDQAFLNPDYDRHVAEYASRLAERFRDRIRYFTPLNEPRITAWYTGKLGWWPPFRRGFRGFVALMLAICRGIVRTERALRDACPDALSLHVDATDLYESPDPELAGEVARRQEIVFLALDLVSGRVTESHALHEWLLQQGAAASDLEWFRENGITLDVVGLNLYPLFSRKVLKRQGGRLRLRMPYASAHIVDRLCAMYYQRYGRPIVITETASEGSVKKRRAWLEDSVRGVARARAAGVPVVGYTWWPMFALVTWSYRQGQRPEAAYLKQMGLWDLELSPGGRLERVETALVRAYRDLAATGARAVGPLALPRVSSV